MDDVRNYLIVDFPKSLYPVEDGRRFLEEGTEKDLFWEHNVVLDYI
jgi:hypothetical protein